MTFSRRVFMAMGASAVGLAGKPARAAESCSGVPAPYESIDPPPEYLPRAPLRASFIGDGPGQQMRVFGRVITQRCQPLRAARLDFWQTTAEGLYDVQGFRFRGAQMTDETGAFQLETVMPGAYNGPRHIHLLVAARIGDRPQPAMLSAGIFFPTPEEFAKRSPARRTREFLDPGLLRTKNGMLMAPCDIVVEVD